MLSEGSNSIDEVKLRNMANAIRFLTIDAVQKANSGHPGMPMGMADVATVLFSNFIKLYPKKPNWPDRDRFILSAGHGSMLLYAINYLLGYEDMTIDQLKNFRQLGSITAGHPEYGHALGIETTTGPLGQGLANAVGFALSERCLASNYGRNLVDHFTYVFAGDGCLMEGISQEAIDFAGHLKLKKLIVFWDDNNISIDGKLSLSSSTNQALRFKSSGWNTIKINGHDFKEISNAISKAKKSSKPTLIACKTIIGFGSPNKANSHKAHGSPLGEEEVLNVRKELQWPHEAFEIPDEIIKNWRSIPKKSAIYFDNWDKNLINSKKSKAFLEAFNGNLPKSLFKKLKSHRNELKRSPSKMASRQSSKEILNIINSSTKLTIGGSADLTGSNLTLTDDLKPIIPGNFKGRYIYFGVREHAMSSIMNGMALHGGQIPYGGTFLVFSDYMRAGIRLSAIMGVKVIYVLTHDSIGLGEDGPTHQPIEHLSILRSTPNLMVFRPCDTIETSESWELALKINSPTVLALSRQSLSQVRTERGNLNLTSNGAYIIYENTRARDITLIATGSEVHLAIDASKKLLELGFNATVVSMPCWEIFDQQSQEYKNLILGSSPRIAIEAAGKLGWEKWLQNNDIFIGMNSFGASAPANDLYNHFKINLQNIVDNSLKLLNKNN